MALRSFKSKGEDHAELIHKGSAQGPLFIYVQGIDLNPRTARRLSKWLLRAADEVARNNHRFNYRRKKGSTKKPKQVIEHQLNLPFEENHVQF